MWSFLSLTHNSYSYSLPLVFGCAGNIMSNEASDSCDDYLTRVVCRCLDLHVIASEFSLCVVIMRS